MGSEPILINGKQVSVHSAISNPEFGGLTVLSHDPWDYVSLWLRRKSQKEACFYWEQSRQFYKASIELSSVASPLTTYYCILNAAKALLKQKNIDFSELHGVRRSPHNSQETSLINEVVKFEHSGVLSSLCKFLDTPVQATEQYNLKEIFYNLPFLHRSFILTYPEEPELFLPINKPRFVYIINPSSPKAWFCAEIDKRYK